jgi:radical SAM-linked protein
VQRLRVSFGKLGDMRLVGHLDLVRLFDRAIRRASIPMAFTGGFHPAPRIMIANALSLGYTSHGEIVEFELREKIDPQEFQSRFAAELNGDLPLYQVQEIPLNSPLATQTLELAEYRIRVGSISEALPPVWQAMAQQVLATSEILQTQTTKSGQVREVDLRERLQELELINYLPTTAEFRYIGSCRNDGTMLRPEQFIYMLSQVSGLELSLDTALRLRLICGETKTS